MTSQTWRLAAVVGLGLLVGLPIGWVLWGRATDRVATALALLEERCASWVLHEEPFDPTGLVAVARAPRGTLWVEPQSLLALDPSERRCTLTDALAPFDAEERARFASAAEALGLRLLAGTTATTPEAGAGWPLFRVIAAGPASEAEAVLVLARMVEDRDPWSGQTTVTLSRPQGAGGG